MAEGFSGPFEAVAPYYDDLMKGVPYRMWVGYLLLLLSVRDSHPKSMLEIGCGTGKLCELLGREGFEMTGIDISPKMIETAIQKQGKRKPVIDYHVADARTFDLNRTFDCAFSFFDSLNNLLTPEDLGQAFRHVASHLPEGAPFVFDLNTDYAFEQKMFDQRSLGKTTKLKYKWDGEWDPYSRIITVTMNFWNQDEPFTEIHRQRGYVPEEVRELLNENGFTSVNCYHSYSLDPPRRTSDRVHYAASKA